MLEKSGELRSAGLAAAALVGGDALLEHRLGGGEGPGEVAAAALGGGEGQTEGGVVEEDRALVVHPERGEAGVELVERGDEVAGAFGLPRRGQGLDGDPHRRALFGLHDLSMPDPGRRVESAVVTEIACFHVDAFTDRRFAGNPAAVCPLLDWLPDGLMQQIAAENALSETAFFVQRSDGDFDLRWFTPEVEVDLCGHATLAAGFVLMRLLDPARSRARFWSRSGPLEVARDGDDFTLDLPARPPVSRDMHGALARALGAAPREVLEARDLVAVFDDAAEIRALRPDMAAIAALPGVFGVAVTAPGTGDDADVDFVSRYFAPAQGIPEDPVTGSAHCTLAPLWAGRLGKSALRARQVSRRVGELTCALRGERVMLTGRAVLIKAGPLYLDDDAADRRDMP